MTTIFSGVDYTGLERDRLVVENAWRLGFPVMECDVQAVDSLDSFRCDLVTMFRPHPSDVPSLVSTAKRMIEPHGLIAISLKAEDMQDLIVGKRFLDERLPVADFWTALSGFSVLSIKERCVGDLPLFENPYLFAYSPRGLQGFELITLK